MSTVVYPAFLEEDLSLLVTSKWLKELAAAHKNSVYVDNKRSKEDKDKIDVLMKPVFRFVYRCLEINGWKKVRTDDPRINVYVEDVLMTGEKVNRVLSDVRFLAKHSMVKTGKEIPLLAFLESMKEAARQVYARDRYSRLLKPKEKLLQQEEESQRDVSTVFTFDC
jgi:hypothetical protein